MPSVPEPFELLVSPGARRTLEIELPEAVAHAAIALITGALPQSPRTIGKPLRAPFEGLWVARRGTYRVIYEINDDDRRVEVLRIDHRRDIYRD